MKLYICHIYGGTGWNLDAGYFCECVEGYRNSADVHLALHCLRNMHIKGRKIFIHLSQTNSLGQFLEVWDGAVPSYDSYICFNCIFFFLISLFEAQMLKILVHFWSFWPQERDEIITRLGACYKFKTQLKQHEITVRHSCFEDKINSQLFCIYETSSQENVFTFFYVCVLLCWESYD